MKRNLIYLIFGVYTLIAESCNQSDVTLIKNEDLAISRNGKSTGIGIVEYQNKPTLAVLNYDSLRIELFNYKKDYLVKSILLNSIFNRETLNEIAPYQFLIQSFDSVFIGTNSNIIFLIDNKGQLLNRWDLNLLNDVEVELVFLPSLQMCLIGNNLYLGNASNDFVGDKEGRIDYFKSVSPLLILNIIDNKLHAIPIKFPPIYLSGDDFRSYHISQCCADNINIYSFALDSNIYLYNSKGFINKINLYSKYWTVPKPYPTDSLRNYYFLKKYLREETRYDRIVFDKYRNLYYRLVSVSSNFQNNDGTLKSMNDWSCMVLDSNFKIINELFFNAEDYFSYYFYPVPEGILIGDSKRAISEKSKICLALFEINY